MDAIIGVLIGLGLAVFIVMLRHRYGSFSGQSPDDYDHLGPDFDLRHHLRGPIQCEGVIYGPSGRVTSRFNAEMTGSWDGNKGTLAETFHYDDGAMQERAWHLQLDGKGGIRAHADDVIGTGIGRQSGPTVQMKYRIRLPPDAGGHVLDVTDWMYLVDRSTIMNRSQFRKFGIKVAELVATIRPKDKL